MATLSMMTSLGCLVPEELKKDDVSTNVATIESHIMDTGGGFSWCSKCQADIQLTDESCPECKSRLVAGGYTVNQGGSDF